MAHSNKEYRFDSEAEAREFADKHRANVMPHQDKYVYGPSYIDGDTLFAGAMAPPGYVPESYWVVTVEVYS